MADAPATGGGGSSWGPFEVILVLLLVIAIFSNLGSKSATAPAPATPKKTTIAPLDDSASRCGLSITAPLSLQKAYGSIRLTGSVNGCNWKPNGDTALFAQVINGAGVPVSDFVAVPNTNGDFINTAFDTTINFTTNPANGTGYIILIPAVQEQGAKAITVRVPIRFVRN